MMVTTLAPLSETTEQFLSLKTGGLAAPGDKLSVAARFRVGNQFWLNLTHAQLDASQEVMIQWLSRRYEGTYAAILPAYAAFDPTDIDEVAQTIVEVVNRNIVRILTEDEVQTVLPFLQADVVGRRIWKEELRAQVWLTEVNGTLGPFE